MGEEYGVDFRQFSMTADEYAAAQALDSLEIIEHNLQTSGQLAFDLQF